MWSDRVYICIDQLKTNPGRSLNFSHMEVNIGIFDLGKPSHKTINPDYIPSGYILVIIMKEIKVPTQQQPLW